MRSTRFPRTCGLLLALLAAAGAPGIARCATPLLPLHADPEAAAARAEGRALTGRLASLRADRRFAALKAEFEAAASIADPTRRKAALRAVVGKGEILRPDHAVAAAAKLRAPVRVDMVAPAVMNALNATRTTIPPGAFDEPQGTKRGCGDASDRHSFPGGDPYVTAISTPAPGDEDCELVSAAKFGGIFNVAAGTKKVAITARLDFTLNADTYALGAYGRAWSSIHLVAVSSGVRFKGAANIPGASMSECRIESIGSTSAVIELEERQAEEVNKQVVCAFDVEGGSGEVTLGFAVRAGIDADLTAVAQADARLNRIRAVEVTTSR
jgi:hypothetical protein